MIKNKLILLKGVKSVERAFKGIWIPKEIWLDENLNWVEKILLVEIVSLDNEQGCWASNAYFADFFKLSKNRISVLINSLKEKGYITIELQYKKGTKQIEKRIIRNKYTYMRKQIGGITENTHTPICENAKDNNTVINNTINNTTQKEQFEKIWVHYPLKKGKENAFKAYQKALKEGTQDEDILNGIQRYKKEIQKRGTKKEYIAYASTWFNQKRWLDEYDGFENNTNDVAKNKKKATKVNWTDIYG